MGLFSGIGGAIHQGVSEIMIARPEQLKQVICYKHPLQTIRNGSQITVGMDEVALFFKDRGYVGDIQGGQRITLHSQNIPFLGILIDKLTDSNLFITEVFFVKTQPVVVNFGGPLGSMTDPLTELVVDIRTRGQLMVRVTDPKQFVIGYYQQVAAGDTDTILDYVRKQFLNTVKRTLGPLCKRENISFADAMDATDKLEQAFLAGVNTTALAQFHLQVVQLGEFVVELTDEDKAQIKAFSKQIAQGKAGAKARQFEQDQNFNQDVRYTQLAGNWQNYNAGLALKGAGEGMAAHGVGGGIAGLGAEVAVGASVGGAMAGAFQNQPQYNLAQPQYQQPQQQQPQYQQPQPPPAAPGAGGAPGMLTCGKCGAHQPQGKFCAECGSPLAPAKRFCTGCSQELIPPTVKFCANCGTSAVAPAGPGAPG